MKTATHSLMAERVAIARAVHQFMDEPPLIFPDPLALRIIGAEGERWMRENLAMFRTEGLLRMRGLLVIRSRFAEDELQRAMEQGASQYVLLGAGLDTFAYRRPELADGLTVYEVDEPATQQWKRERLREAGIGLPPNVRFVPVDFNEGTLAGALAGAGFDRTAPAVFAWLGVSYYLPRESVLDTLRFVAGQGAASQVIFDFAVAESAVPAEFKHLFRQFNAYIVTTSEPWQTWFEPGELIAGLRGLGFHDILHMGYEMARARYLERRADGLLPGPLVGLISART